MEIFKTKYEDFSRSCENCFDFKERIGEVLFDWKQSGLIKEYSYESEHVFDSPASDIYVVSIVVILKDGELFHTLEVFDTADEWNID